MSEQPPRVEPPASPEKSVQRYMTPPRARILKSFAFQDAGALHPDIPTSSFDQSHLTEGLANKDHEVNFNPLALLSSESRNKHYETDNRGFDQQYQSWEQKTQRWINWAANHKSDFREALADLDIANTDQAAKAFYETYLENVPEGASAEERTHLTKLQSDEQIHNGLANFSDKIREASLKDGVVNMAEVDRRLEALRPLLNAFGTADEVAERVRDYVTAQALLDQEDQGVVAKAVMERIDSKMSVDDENSMRALARHAGASPGSLGREPNEDRQRSRIVEGVAAAATGAVAGATLAERGEENDNDEAPVAPIEPPTEAKATEEIDGDRTPGEPEPAPQQRVEAEKPSLPPGEEFLAETQPLTDEELRDAIKLLSGIDDDVPSERIDEVRKNIGSDGFRINVLRELSKLGNDSIRELVREEAESTVEVMSEKLSKLDISDERILRFISNPQWYLEAIAQEKFFAEHPEVKRFKLGEEEGEFSSYDPTAYYLDQSLSPDSQEWQDSYDADMKILYRTFGEVIRHQRGNKEPGEYAQEILSKLNDTLSEEERGEIERTLELPASSIPSDLFEDLGSIIWENLAEESGTHKDDGESEGGVDAQREEAVAESGDDGTVDEVREDADGGVKGEESGDESASEGALSNDAEETTKEDVADDGQSVDEVAVTADGASGDAEQGTNGDVVASEIPANTEDGEEPVRTIDVSTTDTDNDADLVNNGGDEQGNADEQEASEDDDGTPPQAPPPPVIQQ